MTGALAGRARIPNLEKETPEEQSQKLEGCGIYIDIIQSGIKNDTLENAEAGITSLVADAVRVQARILDYGCDLCGDPFDGGL